MKETLLIVEDDLVVANDIRRTLERAGHAVCGIARSADQALPLIDEHSPSLVLLDIYLNGIHTGIDLAHELNLLGIPFIFLSANSNQAILDKVKKTQPDGFIVKPFREKDLLICIDIAKYRLQQRKQVASRSVESTLSSTRQISQPLPGLSAASPFHDIVGASPVMQQVFQSISQVAPLNTSVLITGESGTGKEGIARVIHQLSPRAKQPFIKINCAALPASLMESELFGHEKGAFTGAYERKTGKFEQANGGTLLLDEIGEMTPDMQVKLLRVLQERELERIGGRALIKVDVRIIAATNKQLELEIAAGRFRLDLYYRLLVFPIALPALRTRRDDIPLLVQHFLRMFSLQHRQPVKKITATALRRLQQYEWPGNVRELEHLLERTVVQTTGEVIEDISFPAMVGDKKNTAVSHHILKTMQEVENAHIISVLEQCDQKIAGPGGAAEVLGLPPSTLYSRMKKLGITRRFDR